MSVTTGPKIRVMSGAALNDGYLDAGNGFLRMLQALVQANVINSSTTIPPASPSDGNTYIVGASATGIWSGRDNQIAYWTTQNLGTAAWDFYTPLEGWLIFNTGLGQFYYYTGSAWVLAFAPGPAANFSNTPYLAWVVDQFASPNSLISVGTGAAIVRGGSSSSYGQFQQIGKPALLRATTQSSAGNFATLQATAGPGGSFELTYGGFRKFIWRMRPVDTVNGRYWMALNGDNSLPFNSGIVTNSPTTDIAGFRFSPSAGDSTWKVLCQASNISTNGFFDTGIVPDTSKIHSFEIDWNPVSGVMSFYYDATLLVQYSSHLPPLSSATVMTHILSVDNQSNAVACAADVFSIYCQFTADF